MEAQNGKTDESKQHVCVTDLCGGPVELHFVVTIERAKNKRAKDKVKVSLSAKPKVKRQVKT